MAVESSKMTRNQVHQKLKENFQALCTRCPQLNERKDPLDDSLTNLQWLWNLNVNIACPDSAPGNFHGASGTGTGGHHQPQRQQRARSRQSRTAYTKSSAGGNFRSTAPVSSKPVSLNLLTVAATAAPKYRSRQVDAVARKTEEERADVFFAKEEAEEKPDISKIAFLHSTKSSDPSYPLLSDAAFYSTVDQDNVGIAVETKPDAAELKSSYSLPALIALALQDAQHGRACIATICQWIREHCDYYRTSVDNSWQKSVEKTLKQNDSFVKVPKKRSHSRKTQWEISQSASESSNEDLLGSFAKIRGLSAISFAGSPAGRGMNGTGTAVTTTAAAAAAMSSYLNRKRKQTMPQKIVRLHKGKRRRGPHQNENRDQLTTLLDQLDENPLRDQASQEVGPLKGDFNWTTVFDDFSAGAGDALLDTGTAPLLSPTQLNLNDSASSLFNLAFGSLVTGTGGGRLAPSKHSGEPNENLNLFTAAADADFTSPLAASYVDDGEMSASSSPHQDDMDKLLMGDSLFQSLADDVAGLDDDHPTISIDEFFQAACSSSSSSSSSSSTGGSGLDLTVQGHSITAPPHWAPVSADLESILCESQDSNLSSSTSR